MDYLKDKDYIKICPEVLGGLPIPRPSAEISNGKVINTESSDVTFEFQNGVSRALKIIENEEIEFAVLQSRSPSCGVKQIYDGTFSKKLIEGQGLFARALKAKGIKIIDVEDF